MTKIIVQHTESGKFLTRDQDWSSERSQAWEFNELGEAFEYCRALSLQNVQVVWTIEAQHRMLLDGGHDSDLLNEFESPEPLPLAEA